MTVGEVERGEALLVIAALLRDMDLREGKTCDRSDAQSGKDERISGREPRVAIRDDFLGAAGKKDGERFRRECDLRECLPAPRMPRGQGELYELYRHLFRVVGEGFHDIALMIDHRELLCCERQKRALKEDGKKNDEEGDMEDDVIHRRLRISNDGKYDGRGAAKACEGDQSACGSGRFERGKESEDAEGPCHEGQEERDEEGRPCDLRELRWRGEKSKQEEDHHGEKSSFQKQY